MPRRSGTSRRSAVALAGAAGLALAAGVALAGSAATATATPTSEASGSKSTLSESTATPANDGQIKFTYSTPAATQSPTNWIGIYRPRQVPGQVGSITWQYAPGGRGTLTFATADLDGAGAYAAFYLYDNGDSRLVRPLAFKVVGRAPKPPPLLLRAIYPTGPAALDDPSGLALDSGGDLWVADRQGNRVEELSPGGDLLATIGQGELDEPTAVAVAASGDVWVADTGHDRVVEFSAAGAVIDIVDRAAAGGHATSPRAIAISATGNVWIADAGTWRVEEFSSTGQYMRSVQVFAADGVTVDGAGRIFVSCPGAGGNLIYEYSPTGHFINVFGNTQATYGSLSNPGSLAIGGGYLFVVQPDFGWVTVMSVTGAFHTEFGLSPAGEGGGFDLEAPGGIAIGASGIYVADSANNRILVYKPPSEWTAADLTLGASK